MIVRKNVRSLTSAQKQTFVKALLELKRTGRYDKYVHLHHRTMQPAVLPYEPADPKYRNGAHCGPSFLPWHRAFLLLVESDLRAIDPSLFVPYWDWTLDAQNSATASVVFADDFMGGNGVEADQWRVATGPFAERNGNWAVPSYPNEIPPLPGTGLKRRFGSAVPTLPTLGDVAMAVDEEVFYDTPPYDCSPFTVGFRNRIEGWVTSRGDPRIRFPGAQLHNRVHLWVGGNMVPMTSPHDPIFFLHHSFVDKLWADWQALQMKNNPAWAPHYAPLKDGPPGHNIDDVLVPFTHTVHGMLDIRKLGYRYEPPLAPRAMFPLSVQAALAAAREAEKWRRSPFWAD